MRRLKTLLLGLAVSGLVGGPQTGCMKSSPSSAAPGEGAAYGGAAYDGGGDSGGSYDMDDSVARETDAESDSPRLSSRGSWKRSDRDEEPAAPPSPEMAAPGPTTTTPSRPETAPADPSGNEPRKDIGGRLIIYTAGMRIAVFNLERALEKAEALPDKLGGYVQSMNASDIVLKIPARKLRAAMTELAGFGVVESKHLSSEDVSAEYTDIDSRVRALEGTHKQLLELLSKARTVDEALHVRQALDQVGAELEVLKGRMRQLDSLIAFSTLTVSMYERGPHTPIPSSNDPFPWVDSLGVEATEWN